MFVNVKAKKRQQTLECRPSSLLSAAQLRKDESLGVVQEKTCFNPSKGSRIQLSTPITIDTHDWFTCTREVLC